MELGIPPAGGVNTSQLNMQQAMESSIQNLQANVQKLPIGTILNAIVSGADKNGNLVVKFAGNDLVLSSPFLLNKGANLQLKLESISGSITAEVLSVDGKLPPSQPQQTSNDLEYDLNQHTPNNPSLKLLKVLPEGMTKLAEQANIPTQTGHAQRAEAVNVSTSQTTQAVVKALVIQPMPAIMQGLRANIVSEENIKPQNNKLINSMPQELKAGTEVSIKVTGSALNTPSTTNVPNNSQNPNQQQIATDNKVLGKQDWMAQQNQTESNKQITQGQNLAQAQKEFLPTIKLAENGNIIVKALVIDSKAKGEVLVDSKLGKLLVPTDVAKQNPLPGSTLTLEIMEFGKAPMTEEVFESPIGMLSKSWSALKTATNDHPASLNNIAGSERNLAVKMQAFMEAVKTGDLEEWLGTRFVDRLKEDGGINLLSKLKSDLSLLRTVFAEQNQQGWQTLLFPIFDGKELHQARLSVKDLPERRKQNEKKTGTRFIVELETAYFGEIQLDGLVRKAQGNHFDLIVRTHKQIAAEEQNEIRQIFITASEVTGFKGELDFATMREFPIRPFEEILEKDINDHIKHEGFEV